MPDEFIKILKKGTGIEPGDEFRNRSRRLIFSSHQNKPVLGLLTTPKIGLGLVSILIIFALGGFFYRSAFTETNGSSGHELLSEAEKLDFQINLKEAQYFNNSSKEIASFLKKIEEEPDE